MKVIGYLFIGGVSLLMILFIYFSLVLCSRREDTPEENNEDKE